MEVIIGPILAHISVDQHLTSLHFPPHLIRPVSQFLTSYCPFLIHKFAIFP